MVITYQGVESVKLQFGDTVVAYNPVSKDSKQKSTTFGSDIALVSLNHEDMNGTENAARGDRLPFVISGPGEYEIKEIFVKGFASVSNYGGKEAINTIYSVVIENMNVCFLGALSSPELSSDTIEDMDDVDILFVPIGGEGVLTPAQAYKVAVMLEPKIIIPFHYGFLGTVGDKNALSTFLKEGGEDKVAPVDKLTLKRKDLEGKEGEIVILSSSV